MQKVVLSTGEGVPRELSIRSPSGSAKLFTEVKRGGGLLFLHSTPVTGKSQLEIESSWFGVSCFKCGEGKEGVPTKATTTVAD